MNEGCQYCRTDNRKPIEDAKHWTVEIDTGNDLTMEYQEYGYNGCSGYTYIEINFCPMCGRKLKEV